MSNLIALLATICAGVILIATKKWHGRFSMDTALGVQKFHLSPTPRVGGIAILCGMVMGTAYSSPTVTKLLFPMLIAGMPAFMAGLLEDVTKKVGVLPRLLATMLSGVVAWWLTDVRLGNTGIGALDYALTFTPFAVLFTAFAVGGVANAVNIIDGFNGLAAGSVAIMASALGFISFRVGDVDLAYASFIVATISLGFTLVNWPLGKIFLGDGGAYFLGFLLAWLAVLLPARNQSVTAWASLLACAYPVLEVFFSFVRKYKREGHHPGQPDRVHFHMLLHRRVSRHIFPNHSKTLQNGMTSPFAWIYAAIPALWATLFYDRAVILFLGLILSGLIYAAIYNRLTQFHWIFLGNQKKLKTG